MDVWSDTEPDNPCIFALRLVVARGNYVDGGKATDPGAIDEFTLTNGQLVHRAERRHRL